MVYVVVAGEIVDSLFVNFFLTFWLFIFRQRDNFLGIESNKSYSALDIPPYSKMADQVIVCGVKLPQSYITDIPAEQIDRLKDSVCEVFSVRSCFILILLCLTWCYIYNCRMPQYGWNIAKVDIKHQSINIIVERV